MIENSERTDDTTTDEAQIRRLLDDRVEGLRAKDFDRFITDLIDFVHRTVLIG